MVFINFETKCHEINGLLVDYLYSRICFLKGHLKKGVFCEQKYGSHAEPDALNLC